MYVSTSGENCLSCWLARFSLVITRSMTSSMVRGLSAGFGASVAAMALTPLKIRTKIVVATLRIFSLPSVSQTEFNSHASREIHRLAFAPRRLELDLLRRARRRFIETVAQTTYHAVHLDAAVRQEYHIENHVTFYFQSTPFRCVLRTRLLQDVNSRRSSLADRRFLLRCLGGRLIPEAGGLHFVHRCHHRCRSRAACSKIADFHIFFGPLRLARWRSDFHLLENRIEFHGFHIQRLYLGWCDFCRG